MRFLIGGAVTAICGVIAKIYGAEIGGLFLAFPAIFPSTATLIASHAKRQKAAVNLNGEQRARELAGADAAGAAMGSFGLFAFAAAVWYGVEKFPAAVAITTATVAWLIVSFVTWQLRESVWRRLLLHIRVGRLKIPYVQHGSSPAHERKSSEQKRYE
jgi:uncharacterized membrane protein (GlpM family)